MNNDDFENDLKELAGTLAPATPLASPSKRTAFWLIPSFLCLVIFMSWLQPFREAFLSELLQFPRFTAEIALGYFAALAAIVYAFLLSVPGAVEERVVRVIFYSCLASLICLFPLNFYTSSIPVSMNGKRDFCVYETLIYGALLSSSLLLLVHRRSIFFHSKTAALFVGIGSGLLPAVSMQLACMYDPHHGLAYHYAPLLGVVLFSIMLGSRVLKKA